MNKIQEKCAWINNDRFFAFNYIIYSTFILLMICNSVCVWKYNHFFEKKIEKKAKKWKIKFMILDWYSMIFCLMNIYTIDIRWMNYVSNMKKLGKKFIEFLNILMTLFGRYFRISMYETCCFPNIRVCQELLSS